MRISDWLLEVLGLQRKVDQGTILGAGYSRSWFRITSGDESVEGTMLDKTLQLSIRFRGEAIAARISEEHARRMTAWLNQNYSIQPVPPKPTADKKKVLKLIRK